MECFPDSLPGGKSFLFGHCPSDLAVNIYRATIGKLIFLRIISLADYIFCHSFFLRQFLAPYSDIVFVDWLLLARPLHNPDLFIRQPVQLVDQGIDLSVGGLDLAMQRDLFVGRAGLQEQLLDLVS
jgi:hypothetical protein